MPERYFAYLESDNCSYQKSTIREHKRSIIQYLQFLHDSSYDVSIEETTIKHIHAFLIYLNNSRQLKPSSIHKKTYDIKIFYRRLAELGVMPVDLSVGLTYRLVEQKLPQTIPLQLMLQLCNYYQPCTSKRLKPQVLTSLRNQAILEFLFSTGIKSHELACIKIGDLTSNLRHCIIRSNCQERYVCLGKQAQVCLYRYLMQRFDMELSGILKFRQSKILFTVTTAKGEKPISSRLLYQIIRQIGIERISCPITPSQIRNTFGAELFKSIHCPRVIQLFMGYQHIDSVMRLQPYDITESKSCIDQYHPRSRK